jgi:hypothetical protein
MQHEAGISHANSRELTKHNRGDHAQSGSKAIYILEREFQTNSNPKRNLGLTMAPTAATEDRKWAFINLVSCIIAWTHPKVPIPIQQLSTPLNPCMITLPRQLPPTVSRDSNLLVQRPGLPASTLSVTTSTIGSGYPPCGC